MKQIRTIVKKTVQISMLTQLSRLLGIARELLMIKFLGVGGFSDAFLTAYKIPNSLRKVFAEGALSAAFVPSIVRIATPENTQAVSRLMSLAFLLFEGMCTVVVLICIWFAQPLLKLIAPGFSSEQIFFATICLAILMPFILFISSASLLAGALQAVGHFIIPAFTPVLLNIFFIGAIILSLWYQLPITFLCWALVAGSITQFLLHLYVYLKYNFGFARPRAQEWQQIRAIFIKFAACLPTISFSEINLFIDTSFASLLPKGSVSLLYYANRFMGIPLGVLIGSFATVLLPHFSRISTNNPRRLSFYLHESVKTVLWLTLPIMIIMLLCSYKLFETLFISDKFTPAHAIEASHILSIFLCGLVFLAVNRIFLNTFYALHSTMMPALIALCSLIVNVICNALFLRSMGTLGLALATTLSALVQTILFAVILARKFRVGVQVKNISSFLQKYCLQLLLLGLPLLGMHYSISSMLTYYAPITASNFFVHKIGFWFWTGPVCALYAILLFVTRKFFKIRLFFID